LTLESAIRGMTSLPAQVFGFQDRGEIRAGALADVLVFDPAKVIEKATYVDPHQIAEGFDWVIVNGQIAKKEGEYTGSRAGRVLKR
jgi:N-acyl-D-amino-acid deacylase